jgi:hypothetical protein
LFSITINKGHLFGNELLGFGIASRCSKREFGSRGFGRVLDLAKGRINFSIGKLNEILVSEDFLLVLDLGFVVLVHLSK